LKELAQGFKNSAGFDICKGFAVGRSIFTQPSKAWLSNEIDDQGFIAQVTDNYLLLVNAWQNRNS